MARCVRTLDRSTGCLYSGDRLSVRAGLAETSRMDERKQRAATAATEMLLGGILAGAGLMVFLSMSGLFGMIVGCAGLGMTSHGYLTRREMTGERTS